MKSDFFKRDPVNPRHQTTQYRGLYKQKKAVGVRDEMKQDSISGFRA